MNALDLSVTHGDDNTAELFATLKYNGFEGEGSCFVDTVAGVYKALHECRWLQRFLELSG